MPQSTSQTEELSGWYWSPEEPSEKLPGRLIIEPSGEMRLELINEIDSLDDELAIHRMDSMFLSGLRLPWYLGGAHRRLVGIVSGKTISGRSVRDTPITLDDCHILTTSSFHQPRNIAFIVNRAYIGVALEAEAELQCSHARWIADGIEGWLNPGGPTVSRYEGFRAPSLAVSTTAAIDGLGEAKVVMGLMGGFSREKGNSYEITESGYGSLRPEHAVSWERAGDAVCHVHRFLRFALDRFCSIKQLMIETDGVFVEVVEQRMRKGKRRPYRPGQVRFDALFTADPREGGVVGDPQAVLRRWLEIPRAAQGTLLRLQALMDHSQFVDTQVTSACGAGELWYTQVLAKSQADAQPLIEALPDSVEREISQVFRNNGWQEVYDRRIRPVLDAPNELSTGEKVRRTFDPIEREIRGLSEDARCEISNGMLQLRHPWSHGDVLRGESLGGLSSLVRKARAILRLRVLDYLGVDWRAVVKYNKTLHWELDLEERWHSVPYPIYKGMRTLDACLRYLRRASGWRTLQEINDALAGGGWRASAENGNRVVSHRLSIYQKEGGGVERSRHKGKVHWRISEGEDA